MSLKIIEFDLQNKRIAYESWLGSHTLILTLLARASVRSHTPLLFSHIK